MDALVTLRRCSVADLKYEWDAGAALKGAQADSIRDTIAAAAFAATSGPGRGNVRVRILWAAGRAGFDASDSDVSQELADFQRFVRVSEELAARCPFAEVGVFLVSSAGGIFEGQTCVGHHSIPRPLRAYGRLKWAQEQHLLSRSRLVRAFIYRPSSVYGPIVTGRRLGLVSAMVLSSLRQSAVSFSGSPNTLRDYVFAGDVGAFLAAELLEPTPAAARRPAFLASGRPRSILEIRQIIERVVRRRAYVTLDPHPTNAGDNTYLGSDLPSVHWRPRDVESGARAVYMDWCERGQLGSARRPAA